MGKIKKHSPVKLVIGFIFREENVFAETKGILEKKFGKIDFESETLPFRHTDYYEAEFGRGLKRKFVSFKKLIPPQRLSSIKILTNTIEKRFSGKALRLINIDPGYLDMAKVVLATTKDYRHRIYLDKGIFAEITLSYQNKTFAPWEWTYSDYKSAEYVSIFNHIRELYAGKNKIK